MRYIPHLTFPDAPYLPGKSNVDGSHGKPGLTKKRDMAFPDSSPYLPGQAWFQNEFFLYGVDLFNAGFYWEAHEAWGPPLRECKGLDEGHHLFFKALIQLAAAFLHQKNENWKPAQATLENAIQKIRTINLNQESPYWGIDLKTLVSQLGKPESLVSLSLQLDLIFPHSSKE